MTRFDPSLYLQRLIILKDGRRAYDEEFHRGLNVIRGVPAEGNSVGKSTIADMIFFALGGDLTSWKTEAESCDEVYAQVELSGSSVTLRREISRQGLQPMWIHFGDFETASAQGLEGWQRYGYSRSSDRESFTQVLFRLLGMPEVPAEAGSNITMHQLLRLMYVDQMTPVDRIFRFEGRDSAGRRQAVGDLLCGVFDDRIYPSQLALRDKERLFEATSQQFSAINRVLTNAGEGFNLDFVEVRRREAVAEMEAINAQIAELKGRRFDVQELSDKDHSIVDTVKKTLDKLNADLIEAQVREGQLSYNIEDASALIAEIDRTLAMLRQGEVAQASLGPIEFQFCPGCFAPLQDAPDDAHCKLCRSGIDTGPDKSRFARMRNELEIQLKESSQLQEKRQLNLLEIREKIAKLSTLRDIAGNEYVGLTRNYLTEASAKIDELTSRLGYMEREIIDIERERHLAEKLRQIAEERSNLNSEILKIRDDIANWQKNRDRLQELVYSKVSRATSELLSKDLHTEAEFQEDSIVYFNFAEDRIAVNGKVGFSASSLTVLRNAFHAALHWVSCSDRSLRYPRFLLLDNIEDKGMTERRSQNFQRLLASLSDSIEVEHQIIFTTSMIDPDIEASDRTVGDLYTFENKSLKLGVPKRSPG
jgi:hypothetical protein